MLQFAGSLARDRVRGWALIGEPKDQEEGKEVLGVGTQQHLTDIWM